MTRNTHIFLLTSFFRLLQNGSLDEMFQMLFEGFQILLRFVLKLWHYNQIKKLLLNLIGHIIWPGMQSENCRSKVDSTRDPIALQTRGDVYIGGIRSAQQWRYNEDYKQRTRWRHLHSHKYLEKSHKNLKMQV